MGTVKCDRCRFLDFDDESSNEDVYYKCGKGVHDLKPLEAIKGHEVECDQYKSKYIEYPLTIQALERPEGPAIRQSWRAESGSLVKIRPCGEEYGDETYLGILLGDVDIGIGASYSDETGVLNITRRYNPGIFVPALKKVVYGCESWWGIIKSEDEIQRITNEDIENTWYVKMFRDMHAASAEKDDSVQLSLDLEAKES